VGEIAQCIGNLLNKMTFLFAAIAAIFGVLKSHLAAQGA
jgi:hypothetical protein